MSENKRPEEMERIATSEQAAAFIDEQVEKIKKQVGERKVLLALSGGVDSSVEKTPFEPSLVALSFEFEILRRLSLPTERAIEFRP